MDGQRIYSAKALVGPLCEQFDSRGTTPEIPIISLPGLSEKMWGLKRRKLTIIAARTSHGKSSFAMQVAKDVALSGFRVLYLSLEMDNHEMLERLLCNMMEIDNQHLLKGNIEPYRKKILEWSKQLDTLPMAFSDQLGRTWHEIHAKLEKMKVKPDVVFLDYIQAIKGLGHMERGVMDEYIKKFREMAAIYNFAAVLLSQINRGGESGKDKLPQLHQLKNTGFLEEHADVAVLLHWPYKSDEKARKDKPSDYWLELAKNKGGPTGFYKLFYYPQYYLFKEPRDNKRIEEEDIPDEIKEVADMFGGTVHHEKEEGA